MGEPNNQWVVAELTDIKRNITNLLARTRSNGLGCEPLEMALLEAGWIVAGKYDEAYSTLCHEAEAMM